MGLYDSLDFTPHDQALFDTLPPEAKENYLAIRKEIAAEAPLAAQAAYSLSPVGEVPKQYGSWNVSGEDVALETSFSKAQQEPSFPSSKPEAAAASVHTAGINQTRFCKWCGGTVDPQTQKCSGCGKQYFELPKLSVTAVLLCLSILVNIGIAAYCNQTITDLNAIIENKEEGLSELKHDLSLANSNLDALDRQMESMQDEYDFFHDAACFVTVNGNKYHRFDCPIWQDAYHNPNDGVYILNTEFAEARGNSPCPDCW